MTANLTANLTVSLTYKNEEGAQDSITPISLACPYQAQNAGTIDVPDAESSATVHAIPFGSIAKATCAVILNRTGQDLEITANAQPLTCNLPIGGTYIYGGPHHPAAQPLASLSFKTTALQSGAGQIAYHLFGDDV